MSEYTNNTKQTHIKMNNSPIRDGESGMQRSNGRITQAEDKRKNSTWGNTRKRWQYRERYNTKNLYNIPL